MGSRVESGAEAARLLAPYAEALATLAARWAPDVAPPDLTLTPDVLIYDGDVDIDSLHLEPHTPCVIFEGDLRVRGVLRQDPLASAVYVLGSLHARAITSASDLFAAGDIVADEVIYGSSETHAMRALGWLIAPRLVAHEHHAFAAGGLDIGMFVDADGNDEIRDRIAKRLGPLMKCGRYIAGELDAAPPNKKPGRKAAPKKTAVATKTEIKKTAAKKKTAAAKKKTPATKKKTPATKKKTPATKKKTPATKKKTPATKKKRAARRAR